MRKMIELDESDIIEAIAEKYNVDSEQIKLEIKVTHVGYYETERKTVIATFTEQ